MRWTERQRAMLGAMGITLWGSDRSEAEHARRDVAAPPSAVADTPAIATAPALRTKAAATSTAAAPETVAHAATVSDPDIAALDWESLRARVAACRACRLCESRTQTVFGVGHRRAQCMIIGEAPGENEDLKGEPFVGAAGQLLDRMLHAIGLTRAPAEPQAQVYIANTLKCRPPRNRNPEPDELARCSAFLHRQIELVQPRLLLAMGRFAVQSLLQTQEPIGRLRGHLHRWRDIPVVVTYHPAYLLRNPADKARAWADLCLAAHQLRA